MASAQDLYGWYKTSGIGTDNAAFSALSSKANEMGLSPSQVADALSMAKGGASVSAESVTEAATRSGTPLTWQAPTTTAPPQAPAASWFPNTYNAATGAYGYSTPAAAPPATPAAPPQAPAYTAPAVTTPQGGGLISAMPAGVTQADIDAGKKFLSETNGGNTSSENLLNWAGQQGWNSTKLDAVAGYLGNQTAAADGNQALSLVATPNNWWDGNSGSVLQPKQTASWLASAPTGLIGSTAPVVAQTTTLNPATDTVQGQIHSIIDANGPLMRQATGQAAQQMNARGLLNTSINTGAAQAALYAAATPMATQDANTYATVNREGTQAKNAASSQNATMQNQMTMFSAELASKVEMFNASASNDLTKLGMDIASKQSLANIESSYKILMQGNQSASEIYKQTVKNITDIAANKDMGQAAKDAATASQISMLSKGLEMTGAMSNLDLSQYLDFSGVAPSAAPASTSNTSALPIDASLWNATGGLMYGAQGSPAERYAKYKGEGGTLNESDWYALIDQPRAQSGYSTGG